MHDVALTLVEYLPAAHGGQAWSATTEQAPLLKVPGWHTLQGVQALAAAADQVLVATQPAQTVLDVGVQVALR